MCTDDNEKMAALNSNKSHTDRFAGGHASLAARCVVQHPPYRAPLSLRRKRTTRIAVFRSAWSAVSTFHQYLMDVGKLMGMAQRVTIHKADPFQSGETAYPWKGIILAYQGQVTFPDD